MARKLTLADAISCAKQFGYSWMICEMDFEDGRKKYLRPLRYANEDEFYAFDGKILCIGNPDGSTD
jgi:hypothetical protein